MDGEDTKYGNLGFHCVDRRSVGSAGLENEWVL